MARLQQRGVVRIIGGLWRRTPLAVVSSPGLRPTPERIRKTLFDWLTNVYGPRFDHLTFLDLFAGSGALGFEAASRGAAHVVLVERNRDATTQLRAMVEKLDADRIVTVREESAMEALSTFRAQRDCFDVLFLDPPFGSAGIEQTIEAAATLCRGYVYLESDHALDVIRADALGLTMRRSGRAGAVFYHLLQRKNNEETVDASSDLSRDVRPPDPRS